MRRWIALALGLWTPVTLQACASSTAPPASVGGLPVVPAIDFVIDAFDRFPLVGFSEPRHGAGGTREFLTSLVRHPRFAGTVNDIVVEFGNARYQDVADRYVAGEQVASDQLKQIWENTTVVTGVWTAPMYEGMLTEVRSLNQTLAPGKRLRVVLGDPPIDWTVVRGPADEDMNDWRDAHFAWVVEEQVIKKRRRALLWIGGAHISRAVLFPDSLIHLLDRRFPNRTMVVLAIDRGDVEAQVSQRLRPWPSLMAAPVRDTWLGRLDARAIGARLSSATVDQNMDVAVFWPFPSEQPDEGPRVDPESPMGIELKRRQQLADATTAFRGGKIRFESDAAALTPDGVGRFEHRPRRTPARLWAETPGEGLRGFAGGERHSALLGARPPRGGLARQSRNCPRAPRTTRLRVVSRAMDRSHRTAARGEPEGGARSSVGVGRL